MAMSPRKKMAMGKDGGKQKSAVKLRAGGMVKKMAKGGAAKAPARPKPRPDDLMEGFAVRRGNENSRMNQSEQDDVLRNGGRGKRRMRMGGMVKK